MKVIQYGHGQSRSLGGVGTCTELVKETEAGDIGIFQYKYLILEYILIAILSNLQRINQWFLNIFFDLDILL